MKTEYYYKTVDDVFVFGDGTRVKGPEASLTLRKKQKRGIDVVRVYLDDAEGWEILKAHFPASLWQGKSWQEVYFDV